MAKKAPSTSKLTPDGQTAIFWRILHLMVARYGSHPTGQALVAMTMVFLNERGMPPTLTDLVEATGLPKSSVSRYVSWQLDEGLATEMIDPNDRRRRFLKQTAKGKREWRWQIRQLDRLFNEIGEQDRRFQLGGEIDDAEQLLARMKNLTRKAPKRLIMD